MVWLAPRPDPDPWQDRAACRGSDPALFFPENSLPAVVEEAKRICATCPVRSECLELALSENLVHGIYGGLTPKERRPLARGRATRRWWG